MNVSLYIQLICENLKWYVLYENDGIIWNWGLAFGIMCESLFTCVLGINTYVVTDIL